MKKILFLSILFFASQVQGTIRSIEEGWNSADLVETYRHNSDLQMQWAWQAFSRLKLKGNETILDYGCGDGKISSLMAYMVPKGSVTGVDISNAMISYASQIYPESYYRNLAFSHIENISFSGWQPDKKFDVVTSYCVFHLVTEPEAVLTHIHDKLKRGGKLVMTVPSEHNPAFVTAAQEGMSKRGWAIPTVKGTLFDDKETNAREIFAKTGFRIKEMEQVNTCNIFSSKKDFIIWCQGTITANLQIPPEESWDFFSEVIDRMVELDPNMIDERGFIHFNMKRIDVVLQKI
ncbi:MAG: class I SAM-dependent methyltransferase [Chlamydiales bacterium]